MSETADVVVIGGGIAGLTAAVELQNRGIDDVVVVERDGLGQATSNFGAGSIGLWAHGYVPGWGDDVLEVERYSIAFYAQLAAEGAEFGYTPNGALWFASDEQVFASKVRPILDNGRDEKARALTPDDVAELTGGVVRADSVVGGVLYPSCAQLSTGPATRAVGDLFSRRGGRVELRRPVEALVVEGGKVTGVRTSQGTIAAGAVVLAAGAWNNTLLAEHGAEVPFAPLVLSRLITEPLDEVPGAMPFCFGPEYSGLWMRPYDGGLLWGCAYTDPVRYFFLDRPVPERFDWIPTDAYDVIRAVGESAAEAVPLLARKGISTTFQQGLPCYTPDAHAIVGRVPQVERLYVLAGDNEAGVSHGPGHARLVAEAISAESDVSPSALSPARFGGESSNPRQVVEQMAANEAAYFA